jgi:hypothetical protein
MNYNYDIHAIKPILMERDGLTSEEADEVINMAVQELKYLLDNGEEEEAYDICEREFGLEPDYIDDLIRRL